MEEIVCFCKNISKTELDTAILKGAQTLKDIQETTGACTGNQCKKLNPNGKCCSVEILTMLNDGKNGVKTCCCCS